MRYLPDQKITSVRSPALASARIAPKICQGQLQTTFSEYPEFHPNPFTSGGLIAERVNILETRHKVFPILGEASSPSNNERANVNYTESAPKEAQLSTALVIRRSRNLLRMQPATRISKCMHSILAVR